jgi:hypothetical protein
MSNRPQHEAQAGFSTLTTKPGRESMRAASILVIAAVLIAALFAFDAYEYDGHYRNAVIEQIDHFGK